MMPAVSEKVISNLANVAASPGVVGGSTQIMSTTVDDRLQLNKKDGVPIVGDEVVNTDVPSVLVETQNLVNVPVNLLESHNVLGSKSGMDVKAHCDWLNNSSEEVSDSESFSDPDKEFMMVSDRPLRAANRGKFWKRGGKRR
ncbi:hypothetical protein MA16_Dca023017 [Dendrobium catenatum]|uniref:Uncharacterized protein n=1 Tax=Dendrobium catenatum TaxID=906689 RepID=A0A2I0WJ45_9ASPA|nr:hypothetical protein MA16_Dca023017 [Dendrobium catenatum]